MSIAIFLVTTMTDSGFSNHSSSYCPYDLRSMTSPWNTTTKMFRSVDRCGLHHPSHPLGTSFGTLCYPFAIDPTGGGRRRSRTTAKVARGVWCGNLLLAGPGVGIDQNETHDVIVFTNFSQNGPYRSALQVLIIMYQSSIHVPHRICLGMTTTSTMIIAITIPTIRIA